MTAENNPVRQEFIDMYEENLINEMDAKGDDVSEDEERTMRVNAMVDTALQVRKDMDPLLATRLKSLENLKEYKQYLLSEFKLFGAIDKAKVVKIFAEYLLFALLDEFEVDDNIDFDVFGGELDAAYAKMPHEYQDLRRIYPWGVLIDD